MGRFGSRFRAQRLLANASSPADKDFQEVVSLVDDIARERPRWSKTYYLKGEIAMRTNKIDDASAAFGQAWQYGHGAMLADRLIDLSTRRVAWTMRGATWPRSTTRSVPTRDCSTAQCRIWPRATIAARCCVWPRLGSMKNPKIRTRFADGPRSLDARRFKPGR